MYMYMYVVQPVSVLDRMANFPFSVTVVHGVLAENNNKSKIIIQPKTIGIQHFLLGPLKTQICFTLSLALWIEEDTAHS